MVLCVHADMHMHKYIHAQRHTDACSGSSRGGSARGAWPPPPNPAKYCSLKQPDSRTEVWLRKTTVSDANCLNM